MTSDKIYKELTLKELEDVVSKIKPKYRNLLEDIYWSKEALLSFHEAAKKHIKK